MTKVLKSDLENASNESSAVIRALIADQDDTNELIGLLQDFVSSTSTELSGSSYDAIRNHLQGYIDVLGTRVKVAQALVQSIKDANKSLSDYMEDESVLDTAELDGIRSKIREYNAAKSSAMTTVHTSNTREESRKALETANYYIEQIGILDKKKRQLENLSLADGTASAKLSEGVQEISNFKNAVGAINTIKYTYN